MKINQRQLSSFCVPLFLCALISASCCRIPDERHPETSINQSTFVKGWWITVETEESRFGDFVSGHLLLTARRSWTSPAEKNSRIDLEYDIVKKYKFTDLDDNNFPEVIISRRVRGTSACGKLSVFEWDNRQFRQITMPRLNPEQRRGYRGHDEFQILTGQVLRRFPLYRESDPNSKPTAGERMIWYKKDGTRFVVEDVHDQ